MPMENMVAISHEFRSCLLRVGDNIRFANFLPLEISDLDIILGMDWLTEHRATIDCHTKRVIFGDLNNPEFIYHASIKDTSLDEPRLRSHPVVRIFPDVCPDELLGLPPEREVEFTIELIPGAQPISKAPYRMAPLQGAKFFPKIDPRLGYHQLHVKEQDVSKTAFRTHRFLIMFIDDILVYSKTREEHEDHHCIMLKILRQKKLYAKFSNYDFWLGQVSFLGHIVSADGITIVPAKEAQKEDGKLILRFIGPLEILNRIGEVSYRLPISQQLFHFHNMVHVSLLRGYNYYPYHVVQYPFDKSREDLSFAEEPEAILYRQERAMRKKIIPLDKVL
nr:hypothetical protein [Tanacetum cinerariifolium]